MIEWEYVTALAGFWRQSRTVLPVPPPLPDGSVSGQTVLMTGASGTVIAEAARQLLKLGVHRLILAVPDMPVTGEPGNEEALRDRGLLHEDIVVDVWPLDLLSFDSIRELVRRAADDSVRPDVVLLGAALITTERRISPTDGWEATLMVNHLGCALLALLLVPHLEKAAMERKYSSTPRQRPVLAAVSTMAVGISGYAVPTVDESQLKDDTDDDPFVPQTPLLSAVHNLQGYINQRSLYGLTKLLYLHWQRELAVRLSENSPIVVQACDFGVIAHPTGIATINWEARLFSAVLGRPLEQCAGVVVNACADHGSSGGLFVDYNSVPYPPAMETEAGRALQKRVWEETQRILVAAVPEEAQMVYDRLGG